MVKKRQNRHLHSHSKRETCAQKLEEVEAVVKQLREKHGTAYSTEKLNCWAHMIHLGKHSCLDEPPDLPFFGKRKKTEDKSLSNERACTSNTLSPGRKITLRSQLVDQLARWHELLERGAISKQQYDTFQHTILGDMDSL